jgi:CDP-glucose 4,6-dehydratase
MESLDLIVNNISPNPNFWDAKRVFITGHTGFKGGWLSYWLHLMGAHVAGYALSPNTQPNIYEVLSIEKLLDQSHIADIRDYKKLARVLSEFCPDVVIHMAAQPLVRYSYDQPLETYDINVMGTANLLEAIRGVSSIRATVIVTTDKCYENQERISGYSENEPMGGYDPYSSSKGCAELITAAYRQSFFNSSNSKNAIASARAGNVIGGGDWSQDRLIPDALQAFQTKKPLMIRNPDAVRPWQYVLEPLSGYLILAQSLFEQGRAYGSAWNFGPEDRDARPVREVIDLFSEAWGQDAAWEQDSSVQPHEAQLLRLNCAKAKDALGWRPRWGVETALKKVIEWHKALDAGVDMREITKKQIQDYQNSH